MSEARPFPEQREEPFAPAEPDPSAPSKVLGDAAYATVVCPCCPTGKKTLYYTDLSVTHLYCSGCDHMHRLPDEIKKKRLS